MGYPQEIHKLSSDGSQVSQGYRKRFGKAIAMVGILASLVIAGIGIGAIASIILTGRAQYASIVRLIADSRGIAKDREFLVRMTGNAHPASPLSFARLRRVPQRSVRRVAEPAGCAPKRAAA